MLNASVAGELRVEIQNEAGKPLPGLSLEDCQPVCGDATRLQVQWKSPGSLKRAAGQTVRVRFEMRAVKVYAMQFARE